MSGPLCDRIGEMRHLRGKSIVQPQDVRGCLDAHTFVFKPGSFAVDVNGNIVHGGLALTEVSHDRIRINHYWTRTESWFRKMKAPSRKNRRQKETFKILRLRANQYNEGVDTAILRFVPLLKRNMNLGH